MEIKGALWLANCAAALLYVTEAALPPVVSMQTTPSPTIPYTLLHDSLSISGRSGTILSTGLIPPAATQLYSSALRSDLTVGRPAPADGRDEHPGVGGHPGARQASGPD